MCWTSFGQGMARIGLRISYPKIAFYAPSIDVLRQETHAQISKVLSQKNISTDKILEYHTEAESQKDEFLEADTAESEKTKLSCWVGKGTEGWNCRSLVSCALFKKAKECYFRLGSQPLYVCGLLVITLLSIRFLFRQRTLRF
jgi:hypothetical protein